MIWLIIVLLTDYRVPDLSAIIGKMRVRTSFVPSPVAHQAMSSACKLYRFRALKIKGAPYEYKEKTYNRDSVEKALTTTNLQLRAAALPPGLKGMEMRLEMEAQKPHYSKNLRKRDPFMDRRSGEDRRMVYLLDYFQEDNPDRRMGIERRVKCERREGCVRVSEWSSVCPDYEDSQYSRGRVDL